MRKKKMSDRNAGDPDLYDGIFDKPEFAGPVWALSPDNVTFFCGELEFDKIVWPKSQTENESGGRP